MKRISYLTYIIATCLLSACGNEYTVEVKDQIGWTGKTPGTGTSNGYQWVDLGLSVNWATYNLGASSPEGYGDYYAWGETETKSSYDDWSTYKYCNGSKITMTKYCSKSSYGYNGFTDTKTTLDKSDDVVHVKWGGNWHMPTYAEFEELIENCTWSWACLNGVAGYKVSSKIPGYTDRFIFLPAAGARSGTGLNDVGSYGYYWSSSLYTDYPSYASSLDFNSVYVGWDPYNRFYGFSVRPVCLSDNWIKDVTINLNQNDIYIIIKTKTTIEATVKKGYNDITDKADMVWSSNNTSVATVNNSGEVTGVSSGTAIITASCYGKTATCKVTVKEPVFVDLGLSVKWATTNVGATAPEEYGDYYAWGDTTTYYESGYAQSSSPVWKTGKSAGYSWSTYNYCKGSYTTMTKYCSKSSYGNNGFTDTKTTLTLEDDVAHLALGGSWRMPTQSDFNELLNNCDWSWVTQNGVKGWKVISKKDSSCSIFLPAAGYRNDTGLYGVGSDGGYWSSSLITDAPGNAWSLLLGYFYAASRYRSYGLSVRPVCP